MRRRSSGVLAAALLIAAGLLLWVTSGFAAGRERHSYTAGRPPGSAQVTAGHTYWLAVHGGVRTLQARGVDPQTVTCTGYRTAGSGVALTLAREVVDTKAVNAFASFVASATQRISVVCTGVGAVYVDDAEDATFDLGGLLLIAACVVLVIGVGLLLSALRTGAARVPARAGRPDGHDRSGADAALEPS